MSALAELQQAIVAAAERIGPSVVGLGRGWGRGSGVVVAPGRVLTAAHNLRDEDITVTFADGRREEASVGRVDAAHDLALLEVETGGAEPVTPAESVAVLGSPVLALANPGGRGLRVTAGFVSATERSFRGPRGRRVRGAIEHTAPLPHGSSGGPLVDPDGGLLGLNAVRLEGGLILAVAVADRLDRLERGEAPPPRLGVALAPPRIARRMRRAVGLPERDGLLVRAVEEQSPAAGAGIEPGDLLVAAGARELDGIDALYAALDEEGPLMLKVVRGTAEREVEVAR